MILVLQREVLSDKSTIGRLVVDGDQIFWTLEDKVRVEEPKVHGVTAIPANRYQVTITHSVRFNRPLPLINNVPGFAGVRIHAGNTSEDTEGCILIGLTKGVDFIGKSQMAMSLFLPKLAEGLKQGEVWIDVKNPETGTALAMSKAE